MGDEVSKRRNAMQRALAVIFGLIFSLVLVYCVQHFVAGPFRYLGYKPRPWDFSDVVVAVLANVALIVVSGSRIDTAGRGALAFLTLFVGAPVIWLPVFYGVLAQGDLTVLTVVVVLCFAVTRSVLEFFPSITLPRLPRSIPAVTGMVAVSIAGLAFTVMTTGISLDWVSFADVYEQRDEYSSSSTPAVAYTVGWVGSGILPVLAAVGIRRRSIALSVVGFGGLAVIYMMAGFKSYILGAALVLAMSLLIGKRRTIPATAIYAGASVAVVAAMVLDRLTGSLIFTSIGVRRAFATAGINSAYFYDFFTGNEAYGLRHSVLDWMGEAPYSVPPARLIGLTYYGSTETAANANFLADGMANFGLVGMLLAAVLVGFWLKLVDSASLAVPVGVSFPAAILVLISFSNTASLTVLATHGGIMLVVSLWLLSESSADAKSWGTERSEYAEELAS